MTQDQVIGLIRKAIWQHATGAGKQGKWAADNDISPEVLSAVLCGKKMPTPAICAAVGVERSIERVVTYRKVREAQ